MARTKNPNKVNVGDAAIQLGMGKEMLMSELQRDAKRPLSEKLYPFAKPVQNEATGTWTYNISSQMLENHINPARVIDGHMMDILAQKIVDRIHHLNHTG